jgi:uncharacterized caspase-like protein
LRSLAQLILLAAVFTSPTALKAAAQTTQKYALVIGANRGSPADGRLKYAVRDATEFADVLTSLGGFYRHNVVLLREPDVNEVRGAFAALNARIRDEAAGQSSILAVYYSGHADALNLHMGRADLPWSELQNLAASSAARVRIVIVDACRSGQATQVKGLSLVPFQPIASESLAEGMAVISSAAAGENAQESDRLEGSFFTHHLLTGLRGVADRDSDGRVTLTEAYAYASERTVASTASTLAGLQHPRNRERFALRANPI